MAKNQPYIKKTVLNRSTIRIRTIAVASSIILIAGSYWYMNTVSDRKPNAGKITHDIAPGKEGATLTLADGSHLILDSSAEGVVARQSGKDIILQNNHLLYKHSDSMIARPLANEMNTLLTPKGRRFSLTLPDGTRVWLNALSSIRYPVRFAGGQRAVEMTGEAYFEVAENAEKPFVVHVDSTAVTVLGTSFNLKAYKDEEAIVTTLFTGKVRVSDEKDTVLLRPGQSSSIDHTIRDIRTAEADTDRAIAWKNGYFKFDELDLRQIMRELARWYDVDIIFENPPPDRKPGGRISKDLPLSRVLKSLQTDGVRFTMEGNKLIIKTMNRS